MRGLSYKRGLAALTAVAAVAVLLGACGGAGRKVLVEDKIGRLKRDINKVRFAIRTTKTLIARARGERRRGRSQRGG